MHVAQGKVGHESKQENEQYEQEKDKAYTARGRLVPRRLLSRPIIHVYRLVRRKRRVICGLRQRRLEELLLLHLTRLIYAYRSRSGYLPFLDGSRQCITVYTARNKSARHFKLLEPDRSGIALHARVV